MVLKKKTGNGSSESNVTPQESRVTDMVRPFQAKQALPMFKLHHLNIPHSLP